VRGCSPRLHDKCGHGTAFRTRWIDQGLYQLASFMIMRDPTTWRWSHTRHHTDTLILGRDLEDVRTYRARSWSGPCSSRSD
jgi:fatty acid desaturase